MSIYDLLGSGTKYLAESQKAQNIGKSMRERWKKNAAESPYKFSWGGLFKAAQKGAEFASPTYGNVSGLARARTPNTGYSYNPAESKIPTQPTTKDWTSSYGVAPKGTATGAFTKQSPAKQTFVDNIAKNVQPKGIYEETGGVAPGAAPTNASDVTNPLSQAYWDKVMADKTATEASGGAFGISGATPQMQAATDEAYRGAAEAYIKSLSENPSVATARQKYLDYITSAESGIAGLEGQGRGIPLSIVRGQQEKLGKQAEITAGRLQGDVTSAQEQQLGEQNAALARMNYEQGLLAEQKPQQMTVGGNIVQFDPITGTYKSVYSAPETTSPIKMGAGESLVNPVTGQVISSMPSTPEGLTAYQQAQLAMEQRKLDASNKAAGIDGSGVDTKKVENTLKTINLLDTIEASPYLSEATGMSSWIGIFPGTPTYDLAQQIESLKANLTLENMGIMKGVLSDSDMKVISASASALKPSMSETGFKNELMKIRNTMNAALAKAYGNATSGASATEEENWLG